MTGISAGADSDSIVVVCVVRIWAVSSNRVAGSVVETLLATSDVADHALGLTVLVAQNLHVWSPLVFE